MFYLPKLLRPLAVRLSLIVLAVSLTGVILVAVSARLAAGREFDRFRLAEERLEIVEEVTNYYARNGSWQGVDEAREGHRPRPGYLPFALVDGSGRVVIGGPDYKIGEQLSAAELGSGTPVTVGGRQVGTLFLENLPPPRSAEAQRYLERTTRGVILAALLAVIFSLGVGLFLTRTLTRPLRQLTSATKAMAQGNLGQTVPITSNDELGELAAAFNQMSKDLAHSNQLRRQMTADIAHDLRTPLTVLTGYIESMRDGVLKPTGSRFETMYLEAKQLEHLVADLRLLSLSDAGELPLNLMAVSAQALLVDVAAAFSHLAEKKGVVLDVAETAATESIVVDPDRMGQVLGNLLVNALRHTLEGGQITLSAVERGAMVELSVADTGTGIHPEVLPYIFDRFYRGDPAREQHEGESGLGLAIAKSLVEAHGGEITAESEISQGSTFRVTLPRDFPNPRANLWDRS